MNVKIAADGTNIGRDLSIINFTFTVLNESKKAKTAVGNYTLGISKLNEDYDGLEEPIKYIINNIKDLKKFEFKGNNYEVKFFFCSDWKFTSIVLCLYAATSNYPCLWCTASSDKIYDLSKNFSITDSKFGARTHQEQDFVLKKN